MDWTVLPQSAVCRLDPRKGKVILALITCLLILFYRADATLWIYQSNELSSMLNQVQGLSGKPNGQQYFSDVFSRHTLWRFIYEMAFLLASSRFELSHFSTFCHKEW